MAFKSLVIVGAVVFSFVRSGGALELNTLVAGQDVDSQVSAAERTKLCSEPTVSNDYKKQIGCPMGDSAITSSQSTTNTTVTTNTATNTLKLFKSQPSTQQTPTVFGARMDALKAREEAKQRKAVEVAELQQRGSDVFGLMRLLEIAAFAIFVLCPLMLTPTGRNALIAAGVVTADSEITKLSIKASGGLAAQLANFPLVEQALAAMGFADKKGDEFDGMEMHRTLINESDGDSEDEAEIIVDLGSLSRPMNNRVEKQTDDFDPDAPLDALPQSEILIDLGSAPLQQQDLLKYDQHDLINIDYQNGDFATDDFFDEDDDF